MIPGINPSLCHCKSHDSTQFTPHIHNALTGSIKFQQESIALFSFCCTKEKKLPKDKNKALTLRLGKDLLPWSKKPPVIHLRCLAPRPTICGIFSPRFLHLQAGVLGCWLLTLYGIAPSSLLSLNLKDYLVTSMSLNINIYLDSVLVPSSIAGAVK